MLDTTYFFAALMVRANGTIHSAIHSGLTPGLADWSPRLLHHAVGHPAEEQRVGLRDACGRVMVQRLVGEALAVIAAAVEGEVDRVAEGAHVESGGGGDT
ncbi:MAG: hypothetical protein V9E87_00670 [Gemmatimonadales bacterium]